MKTIAIIIFSFALSFGMSQNNQNFETTHNFYRPVIQELPYSVWLDIHGEIINLINGDSLFRDSLIFGDYKNNLFFNYKGYCNVPFDTNFTKAKIEITKSLPLTDKAYKVHVNFYSQNEFIRPTSSLLNNGRYIMYYNPYYDVINENWVKNKVYCKFSIKDSLFDDKITFFFPNGDTLANGFLNEGQIDSCWTYKLPYNSNSNFFDFWYETSSNFWRYELNFLDGKSSGMFKFWENDILRSKGILKDSIPIGEWKTYHNNGKLANQITFIDPTYTKDCIFMSFVSKTDSLPSGNFNIYIPGLNFEPIGVNIQTLRMEGNGKKSFILDKQFLAYYDNGQLMADWTFENGKIIKGGIVYYRNGNIFTEWIFNKKGSKGKQFIYNSDGSIRHVIKLKRGDY